MSVYGTIDGVTMMFLGQQTFFLVDRVGCQLDGVNLKLSIQAEGVVPFSDSMITGG